VRHNGIEREEHEYHKKIQFVHELSNEELFLTTTEDNDSKIRPQTTNVCAQKKGN
jgi:hypothetical protein